MRKTNWATPDAKTYWALLHVFYMGRVRLCQAIVYSYGSEPRPEWLHALGEQMSNILDFINAKCNILEREYRKRTVICVFARI